jgi:two-component system, OmpR family, response regulator MprA
VKNVRVEPQETFGNVVPRKRILYAEDERSVREAVVLALDMEGYEVLAVNDGETLMREVPNFKPNLVIVDVMMPNMDGLAASRRIRSDGLEVPILMLTARSTTTDRISGLEAGADAYLAKPFDVEELLAYVRALLRRPNEVSTRRVVVGDLVIDEDARRVWRADQEIVLTKTEFDLLSVLARHAGRVLTHAVIYELVWQFDFGPASKTLAVNMSSLRRKLEPVGTPHLLRSIRGVGYSLRVPDKSE